MKKKILYIVLAAVIVIGIRYGLKNSQDKNSYKGTTLKVLSVITPQFKGIELRDQEFTDQTGIEVEWTEIPFPSLQEKVASVGVAANGNFDVVNYLDSWGPANAHWLVSLDELMEKDEIDMSRYPQAFAKSASFEGKVIGFPLRAHPQLFFYRADLFKELGLQAPESWDEVIAAGKKIKQKKGIDGLACYYGSDGNKQNLFVWLNFLWASGSTIFDQNINPNWNTPQAIQATKDYLALHTQHRICGTGASSNLEQDARIQFEQGKVAMIPVWWWAYSSMVNPKKSTLSKDQIAFTGMPKYQGKVVTYAISMPFSISKYSKNQQAAWEFLKWLSSPNLEKRNAIEREISGVKIINNVVTHKENLLDEEVNAANNYIQKAAYKSLENSDIMPQIREWPEIGDLIANAIQAASTGGDVEMLMKQSAERATLILKQAGY